VEEDEEDHMKKMKMMTECGEVVARDVVELEEEASSNSLAWHGLAVKEKKGEGEDVVKIFFFFLNITNTPPKRKATSHCCVATPFSL
jgi:hypothetical protein